MTRRGKWWTALAVTVLAAAVGVAGMAAARRKADASAAKKAERPPLEFALRDLVQLQPRPLSAQLLLPGTIQAVSLATVRAKVAAEVQRVLVREGESVRAGQVLVEFDTAPLRALLAERTAALEAAKAQLGSAERTRQINAKLIQQSFISQNAFDAADSAHQAQRAAVAMAQAQLDLGRLQLGDAVVRAPIAGSVARRYVQPGEKVSFDAPLVQIIDLARLEVHAQAPVSDVPRVRPGMAAQVEVEGLGGRLVEGKVERINPSAEAGSRNVNVYVAIDNADALLRVGMFARVRLAAAGGAEVPSLPTSAVREESGQTFVWVLAEGRLARRMVGTGLRDERAQRVEIVSGLAPAELALATKFDNLKEGLAAKVAAAPGPAKSGAN